MVFTSSDSKQETKQLVTNFEHPLKKKQVVSLIGMNLIIFSPAKTSF